MTGRHHPLPLTSIAWVVQGSKGELPGLHETCWCFIPGSAACYAMAAGNGQGMDAFMRRMDQLSQKLTSWQTKTARSATPPRNDTQACPVPRDSSPSQRQFKSSPSQPSHAARPDQNLHDQSAGCHRSALKPMYREPEEERGSQRATWALQPGESSPARNGSCSPSMRGSISILSTYDRANRMGPTATDWLADEAEGSKKATPEFERTSYGVGGPARMIHSDLRTHGLSTAEWHRSRNKLMGLSPSHRGSASPKRLDRSPVSRSPVSKVSQRSRDKLSPERNPFQMPGGGAEGQDRPERQLKHMNSVRAASLRRGETGRQDGQESPTAFNARVEALQQRVSNAPPPVPAASAPHLQR